MVRRSSTESFERIAHLADRAAAAPGRPARPELAGQPAARGAAARALQPGRAVVRADQLAPAVAHRRVHRARRDAHARRRAAGRSRDPLLPGVELGDVRPRARDAAERVDALLPAQPVRGGQGLRPLDHRELPRELRPVRGVGDPVQPRVAAPRARVRHAPDQRGGRAHQARPAGRAARSATSTRGATGATRPSTSTRCGACCRPTAPTTT